jgi:hypothetical protein
MPKNLNKFYCTSMNSASGRGCSIAACTVHRGICSTVHQTICCLDWSVLQQPALSPWTCLSYNGCADSGLSVLLTLLPWTNMFCNLQQPVPSLDAVLQQALLPRRVRSTAACYVSGGVGMAYSSLCCTRKYLFKIAFASYVHMYLQRSLCCCTLITL